MSLSAGLSSSQSQSTATQQSTGPTAFGSVNIAPASSSSSLWPMLAAAAAALVALLLFKRKR
jgi:hypothetical protein